MHWHTYTSWQDVEPDAEVKNRVYAWWQTKTCKVCGKRRARKVKKT